MPRDKDDPQIGLVEKELEASLERIGLLEKENKHLKQEVARLRGQIISLRSQGIVERKSALWKKLQNPTDSNSADPLEQIPNSPTVPFKIPEEVPAMEKVCSIPNSLEYPARKERPARVPKPPPRPIVTPTLLQEVNGRKEPPVPAPPPPPPIPSKLLVGSQKVRRVPEVMEFYRSLTKRDARMENGSNLAGTMAPAHARNMIGEIENRSSYLLAIKSDVETKGEFIRFLTREVENASCTEISDVEAFIKWLDDQLSYLVDERAVLKHFPEWPEQKADAMREAAFTYRDLKNLESEISSFRDNPKHPSSQALKRMQLLQDRLEQSVHNIERVRESTSKKYRDFHIPWEWMLENGVTGQLKLSSLRLAKEYLNRVVNELEINEGSQGENLMLQGVRFAFRVHQFAGGFDAETMHAFEELRKVGRNFHQKQHTANEPQPMIESKIC